MDFIPRLPSLFLLAFFGFTLEGAKQTLWIYCIHFYFYRWSSFLMPTHPSQSTRKDALRSFWRLLYTHASTHWSYLLFATSNTCYLVQQKLGYFDKKAPTIKYLDTGYLGNCFFTGQTCFITRLAFLPKLIVITPSDDLTYCTYLSVWFQQTVVHGEAFTGLIVYSFVGYKAAQMIIYYNF